MDDQKLPQLARTQRAKMNQKQRAIDDVYMKRISEEISRSLDRIRDDPKQGPTLAVIAAAGIMLYQIAGETATEHYRDQARLDRANENTERIMDSMTRLVSISPKQVQDLLMPFITSLDKAQQDYADAMNAAADGTRP
jgi:hypothetical protein